MFKIIINYFYTNNRDHKYLAMTSTTTEIQFPPSSYSKAAFTLPSWLLKKSPRNSIHDSSALFQQLPTSQPSSPTTKETSSSSASSPDEQHQHQKSIPYNSLTDPQRNQSLLLLALHSLDLTAPALIYQTNFIQLSGHLGSLQPASPTSLWKKTNAIELHIYQELMDDPNNNQLKAFVPQLISHTEYNGSLFIELENLLNKYNENNVWIMDIKMGTRTFDENECKNAGIGREDLYQKMIKIDKNEPTEEEHRLKKITKLRYMQFREQQSSTAEFGFRIDGIKMNCTQPNTSLQHLRSRKELSTVFKDFLPNNELRNGLLTRLTQLRNCLESSEYFYQHEVIGSSLLIIHDQKSNINAWMIDFAKTYKSGFKLNHRIPWTLNSHEDGYLTGLDNLIQLFIKEQ